MANSQGPILRQHLHRLAGPAHHADTQLLQQFLADRDEAAFALLVQRHGPMVLEVCRGVLRHHQDAEDAFQAAFLVLARRAHTIRKQGSLASWLHGVAYRLALKARALTGRRRDREPATAEPCAPGAVDDLTVRELRAILHEEVHRLAEKYRTPLLLCYWEGKTRDEAAAHLGVSPGAFKKCLERARHLLGGRLARRGLAPAAAFAALLLSEHGVRAALPSVLIHTTARAAVAFVTGKTAGATAAAVALAKGTILTMNLTKWATMTLAVVLLCGLGAGFDPGVFHLPWGGPMSARAGTEPDAQPAPVGAKAPAGGKADKERIVGVWRFTKGVNNEEDLPRELIALGRLKFTKDGEVTLTIAEVTKKSKYALAGPGKIDLNLGMTDKEVSEAIYKFDGNDSLTLCANEGGKARPAEFKSKKADGQILFHLTRAKAGEEAPTAEEIAKFKGGADKLQEAAARALSVNRLQQIGLAMHTYHDKHQALPAHAIYAKDGKTPLLSWRVAILPYIEQTVLYKEFKLDEPWDSPHNVKLIPKMPQIYVLPGAKAKPGETYYQVVTGPGTLFDGAKRMKFTDVTDGTSNTLLVAEAKGPVVWTRPDDLKLPKDKDSRLPVGGTFSNGFNALLCDGSVHFMAQDVPVATFRAFITPAAGD